MRRHHQNNCRLNIENLENRVLPSVSVDASVSIAPPPQNASEGIAAIVGSASPSSTSTGASIAGAVSALCNIANTSSVPAWASNAAIMNPTDGHPLPNANLANWFGEIAGQSSSHPQDITTTPTGGASGLNAEHIATPNSGVIPGIPLGPAVRRQNITTPLTDNSPRFDDGASPSSTSTKTSIAHPTGDTPSNVWESPTDLCWGAAAHPSGRSFFGGNSRRTNEQQSSPSPRQQALTTPPNSSSPRLDASSMPVTKVNNARNAVFAQIHEQSITASNALTTNLPDNVITSDSSPLPPVYYRLYLKQSNPELRSK